MNETRSTRYQRLRRRARAAGLMSGLGVLTVVALTPIGRRLETAAIGLAGDASGWTGIVFSLVLYVAMVVILWEAAAVPSALYLTQRLGRRYGTSELGARDVLGAQAKAMLVQLPVVLGAVIVIRFSQWAAGGWWWLLAGVVLAAGIVVVMHQLPGILAGFGGATPVRREPLTSRIRTLAERAEVPVAAVLELPDREPGLNALVAGLGPARRIFLSSQMLRDWADDEVLVVVAHEIGHCVHHDGWRTLALHAGLMGVTLGVADWALRALGPAVGLASTERLASLSFLGLAAALVWISTTPLRHAQSRLHERRADAFALALTGGADAFDAAIRRLGERHLAEERPSRLTRWLFHRHPSVGERLEYARAYRNLRV